MPKRPTARPTARHRFVPAVDRLEDRSTPAILNPVPVADTEVFPHSAVVRIETWTDWNNDGKKDDGETGTGTGAMIGPSTVLTAAHVLYNDKKGHFSVDATSRNRLR